MTTITLNIQWRGHQPGDTITVDETTAEWLRRTGATAPDPELSNREHARRTGANHETVGNVRKEMVGSGALAEIANATTSDGRTYPVTRPASQPPRPEPEPEPEPDPASAPEAPAKTSERPRKTAPVATWRAYADALGIDPKGLTKAEIIAATIGA